MAKIFDIEKFRSEIIGFFKTALDSGQIDAVMMPMLVPSKDSYAWIVTTEKDILTEMNPIAPIMPINGANALKRYTRKGKAGLKLAVALRPCEIRASVELMKLKQVNPENIFLFSYDCVGAVPMQDYIVDAENKEQQFDELFNADSWKSTDLKPVCNICDKFSLPACDIHFGFSGCEILMMSNSEKGKNLLSEMQLDDKKDDQIWKTSVEKTRESRTAAKEKQFIETRKATDGFANLQETFAHCIGCHNCGSVCPICYCRQCYFDSSVSKPNSDFKLIRAEKKGALAFPLDRLMFHIGRMSHMSLSCVSCGLCSDACPVDIPVANIFSFVGSETQKTFEYEAGASAGDALPMRDYKLDELGELSKLINSAEGGEANNE